ncbi:penicillin-binding protein 1C [Sediminicoccus rosea]|uniref:peptidoglycan glycosyltransferase n=1 Tax=Sediminicoccus rosea TaxID=1225128 RepID=A0ABZ0PIF2_9PROT|nr:transglycosylase domain-containing protein [Sediminicoccus rosea]WPB85500.1 transglycosylase domain-containing protein [Sediminicoccus rosea]
MLPALAWALDRAFPPPMARFENAAREVTARDGRTLSVWPAAGGVWRLRTRPDDVPPHLLALLIAAEDRRFHAHPGVDPLALARAAAQWVRAGRVVSGGSTISMQAARLLEPRPRNLRSKVIEIARALQLEWRHGKAGVLEIWLTLAPQGGNLEGMRAGALAWFGRPAQALDASEAALLVALARRPEALRPDRHPEAARRARDAVLLARAPDIASAAEISLAGEVPTRRLPLPRHAPHFARDGATTSPARVTATTSPARVTATTSPARVTATTLDLDLQRATEAIAREALARLPERVSLAILVTDLRTRETRALVGGDWMNPTRAGALDLTRAVRSPGSTLKPLVYALAFETGVVTPETLMEDLPRRFGDYAPENFDRAFQGRLRIADALRQSLNQPAVALLNEVGPLRLASVMKAGGAVPRLPPGAEPSLPLALGGVGITLRELVGLYARLGDGGAGLIERRAANLASAILVQPIPGGGPAGIAWKTGTSWGGRDAWAIGMDQRHVVGIWVGRPDGTPMPNATGARLALPLLGQVFERLPPAPRQGFAPRPLNAGLAPSTDALRLLFPPPRATLPEAGRVVLRAAGGQRPLTFLVDGAPLSTDPARREASWVPPGPGFYRITVLDADGAAARTELRVR